MLDCSIFVSSCDAYSDLWTPFFALWRTFWPDCPFPVYLGSNTETFCHPGVVVLRGGYRGNWTEEVRAQLAGISTKYVLICLEDFFLRSPVPTAKVLYALSTLQDLEGMMMRLVPKPPPRRRVDGFPDIGEIEPGDLYRVSLQSAIWRLDTFLSLLNNGETIWEFEMEGSNRSKRFPAGFYSLRDAALTYGHHVVERGKWFPRDAAFFGAAGIGCDFERRAIMTQGEYWKWRCRTLGSDLWRRTPVGKHVSYLSLANRFKRSRVPTTQRRRQTPTSGAPADHDS